MTMVNSGLKGLRMINMSERDERQCTTTAILNQINAIAMIAINNLLSGVKHVKWGRPFKVDLT